MHDDVTRRAPEGTRSSENLLATPVACFLDHARAGKPDQRFGSAMITSPSDA